MSKQLETLWDDLVIDTMCDSKNGNFFGSLLCSMTLKWDTSVDYAYVTPDLELGINPDTFKILSKEHKLFLLFHELSHIAYGHFIRQDKRDRKIWGLAADYEINHDLVKDGYSFIEGGLYEQEWVGLSAEEIYEILIEIRKPLPNNILKDDMVTTSDLGEDIPIDPNTLMATVTTALNQTKLRGEAGSHINGYSTLIATKFMKPSVNWDRYLYRLMTAKLNKRSSYRRPNRRFTDVILPSRMNNNGLIDLTIFMDTSGSVSDSMIDVLNSDCKFIIEKYKPRKLTVVQFDTSIRKVTEFKNGEKVYSIQIHGRGGTCLDCVSEYITEHGLKDVIVLSDLECTPMEKINTNVYWVCFNNPNALVNFGELIHVNV